jgi:hypothetical protein
VVCRGILGNVVASQGNGPYDENDFDKFLVACGIEAIYLHESDADVVVLGQEGWDSEDLDAVIEARRGGVLKVYSQEMVVAAMAIGQDLFDVCDDDELMAFGEGHPALEYLLDHGFDWPTTEVQFAEEDSSDEADEEE